MVLGRCEWANGSRDCGGSRLTVLHLCNCRSTDSKLYVFRHQVSFEGSLQSHSVLMKMSSYSENEYLASSFDTASALTVKFLVPISAYWAIIVGVFWVLLVVTAPAGYKIVGAEYISRHLYFNIVEVTALCLQLVGSVTEWPESYSG